MQAFRVGGRLVVGDRHGDHLGRDGRGVEAGLLEDGHEATAGCGRARRRERTTVLLATSLDVLVWKALRRDQGLDPDRTADHLRALVEGVLGSA